MEGLALVILIIFSLVGFVAIFFTTFGTLIILLGAILYAVLTTFSVISIKVLLFLLALYLCGEASEYIFIIIGARKFGASNIAVTGAIIGGIIGAILGVVGFLGIGFFLTTFMGIFLGAFLAELIVNKDFMRSLKSGAGSVMGRIGSIMAKVVIALAMLTVILFKIVLHYKKV